MTRVTAIIHACNDERRLGRALESLHPCDQLLVVDYGSGDSTIRIACDYGATVIVGLPGGGMSPILSRADHDWILCVSPCEAMFESLEASLFSWKLSGSSTIAGYRVGVREQVAGRWRALPPELRLVHRERVRWTGHSPWTDGRVGLLEGELLKLGE